MTTEEYQVKIDYYNKLSEKFDVSAPVLELMQNLLNQYKVSESSKE